MEKDSPYYHAYIETQRVKKNVKTLNTYIHFDLLVYKYCVFVYVSQNLMPINFNYHITFQEKVKFLL